MSPDWIPHKTSLYLKGIEAEEGHVEMMQEHFENIHEKQERLETKIDAIGESVR